MLTVSEPMRLRSAQKAREAVAQVKQSSWRHVAGGRPAMDAGWTVPANMGVNRSGPAYLSDSRKKSRKIEDGEKGGCLRI
jgi:hypothetical protein